MTTRAEKTDSNRSRILSVSAKNVKTIREVRIDDLGNLHEIRGDANQGKTAILDSIEGALQGLDKSMVRRGSDKAELELVLSDAKITRIINAGEGADTLMVTGSDGKTIERAKDFLRTICGRSTFRPLAWVNLGAGEKKGRTERLRAQRDQLLEALDVTLSAKKVMAIIKRDLGEDYVDAIDQVRLDGIDFDQHPFVVCRAFEKAVSEFRTLKNAEKDKAQEVLRNTPAPEIAPPRASAMECQATAEEAVRAYHEASAIARSLQSIVDRRDRLAAAVEESTASLPDATKVEAAKVKFSGMRAKAREDITRLEAELAAARECLAKADDALMKCAEAERKIERHKNNVADLAEANAQLEQADGGADLEALREEMEQAQALTRARQLQDKHDAAAVVAAEAEATAKRFDDLVKLFRDGIPKQLLSEAQLPVEGLTVDDETILIDGVPLHQLGTSRQIRLGVLIAHALNPRSAFVLVDGAESMGKADRKALAETAGELGLQLIMTFVDPDAEPRAGVTVMREGKAV